MILISIISLVKDFLLQQGVWDWWNARLCWICKHTAWSVPLFPCLISFCEVQFHSWCNLPSYILHVGYCPEVRKDPDQIESLHRLSQMEAEGQSDQEWQKQATEVWFLYLSCQSKLIHCTKTLTKKNDGKKIWKRIMILVSYGKHMATVLPLWDLAV